MVFYRNLMRALIAAGFVGLAHAACAAPGYVVGGADLRAGPDENYPMVASLPPGTPAEIYGCLPGWSWCDIVVNGSGGGVRGWAAGVRLQVVYDDQPAFLPQYGAEAGLPLIGFDMGSYWDRNYRGQSWYGSEEHWRGPGHDRDAGRDDHREGGPDEWHGGQTIGRPDGRESGRHENGPVAGGPEVGRPYINRPYTNGPGSAAGQPGGFQHGSQPRGDEGSHPPGSPGGPHGGPGHEGNRDPNDHSSH